METRRSKRLQLKKTEPINSNDEGIFPNKKPKLLNSIEGLISGKKSEQLNSNDEDSVPSRKPKQLNSGDEDSVPSKKPKRLNSNDEGLIFSKKPKLLTPKCTFNQKNDLSDNEDDDCEMLPEVKLLTNLKNSANVKPSYESDSDSSDELDARQFTNDIPGTSTSETVDSFSIKNDEGVLEDVSTSEYFDFTPLLSQATEKKVDQPTNSKSAKKKPVSKSTKSGTVTNTNELNVFELLAMGEDTDLSAQDIRTSVETQKDEYEIPKQVEVVLEPSNITKNKKKPTDVEMALRRRLNFIRRENQVYVHKVHLLCWIAHGNYLNGVLNSAELLSIALSLLPSDKCGPPKRLTFKYLEEFLKWFDSKIFLKKSDSSGSIKSKLKENFKKKEASDRMEKCFMFICILRAIGIQCRLVINLNVISIKPKADELLITNTDDAKNASKSSSKKAKPLTNDAKGSTKTAPSKTDKASVKSKTSSSKSTDSDVKSGTSKSSKAGASKQSKKSEYFKEEKPTRKSNRQISQKSSKPNESESEDDCFVPKKKNIDRRVLSSEDENTETDSETKKNKCDYWAEVYVEEDECWTCVEMVSMKYHCGPQLYANASHPVRYVLAWNTDQTIKDVTRRYVPQFCSTIRKLRVDEEWWKETLEPYRPFATIRDKEEDEALDKMMEEQPFPTAISEFKNHPLYVLPRHLLKFQALYPADTPTLGFIKGEPIYSRLCVHQLHGREMWIKEAKTVKIGEKPYKVVKGRPRRDKFGGMIPGSDLELFGSWQVEDYDPPAASDGLVPRNSFGNVDLFKPSMLPKGTVHLQIPGLQKVANKLKIDCASAIIGFEFSNGFSYPVKDGFVVCEEYKDVLLDAYNEELEEVNRKEEKKRETRIYGNWKTLIKGLFIREKLKKKYKFGVVEEEQEDQNESKPVVSKKGKVFKTM